MANVFIRDLEFHVDKTDEEEFEIRDFQNRYIMKMWIRRCIWLTVLISIGVTFQAMARISVPYMFGAHKPLSRVFYIGGGSYLILNFLSWLELMYETRIYFDIETARVLKVKVKKKLMEENYRVLVERFRYIMCEYEGEFILDKVEVRSNMAFKSIKEGQEVYIQRAKDDGHYVYYYVA